MNDVMQTLEELWKKMREKNKSIPSNDAMGQPDLTSYDGIRAGLAWAQLLVTNKMNELEHGWEEV